MFSSVARGAGGLEPPIGLKSMQNTTFLVLLGPIFALKMKIAPPQRDWRAEVVKNCCDLDFKTGVFALDLI